jgi:transcriptional regulator GlxA family with amidase domain
MVAKPARKSVAIVVPPSAQSLDVSGPLDAFLEANRQSSGGGLYDVRLIATGVSRNIKAGGMSLVADSSIVDDVRSIDTMLVAGTPDYALAYASAEFHAWLRRRAPKTRRYGSVCTGAFFLGAAGLLDGMSATTHGSMPPSLPNVSQPQRSCRTRSTFKTARSTPRPASPPGSISR